MKVWLNVRQCLVKPWAVLFGGARGVYEFVRKQTRSHCGSVFLLNEAAPSIDPSDRREWSWTVWDGWRMAWRCHGVNGEREGESPLWDSSRKDNSTVPSSTAHLILLSTTNSQCFCVWKNFIALSTICFFRWIIYMFTRFDTSAYIASKICFAIFKM